MIVDTLITSSWSPRAALTGFARWSDKLIGADIGIEGNNGEINVEENHMPALQRISISILAIDKVVYSCPALLRDLG